MKYLLIMSLALALAACNAEDPAADRLDARALDGTVLDAGDRPDLRVATPDAALPDARIELDARALADATVLDATVPDAAPPDAVMLDAVMPDAAMPDAAMPDAAMLDAAMPDAMVPECVVPACDGIGVQIEGECAALFAPTCAHPCMQTACGVDGCAPGEADARCDDPLAWMHDVVRFDGRYTTAIGAAFRAARAGDAAIECIVEPRPVGAACDDRLECTIDGGAGTWSRDPCDDNTTEQFDFEALDLGGHRFSGDGYFWRRGLSVENSGDFAWAGPLTPDAPIWARAGESSVSVYRRSAAFDGRLEVLSHRISAAVNHPDGRRWHLTGQLLWRTVDFQAIAGCVDEPVDGSVRMTVVHLDGSETVYDLTADGAAACDGAVPLVQDGVPIAPMEDLAATP